jgi:hypothetical protein
MEVRTMSKQRFEEIMDEISRLNEEAFRLLPNRFAKDQARGYWYAHIQGALGGGGSMITMQDSVNQFEDEDEDEDEDASEEDNEDEENVIDENVIGELCIQ